MSAKKQAVLWSCAQDGAVIGCASHISSSILQCEKSSDYCNFVQKANELDGLRLPLIMSVVSSSIILTSM